MTIELIKSLSGHSGCRLNLYSDQGNLFVRKDAGKTSYNSRLRKQYIKQRDFQLSKIKTPKVLRHGVIDQIFYFDMEYIRGVTLAAEFLHIPIPEIDGLISLLFNALRVQEITPHPKASEIFEQKIEELSRTCAPLTPTLIQVFERLRAYDFSQVPRTHCCGDLTLENILLTPNGELYVIDLLDSFYNSWMIDVAKILQDLELRWSYRTLPENFNLNLRLNIAKNQLLDQLRRLPNGNQFIKTIYMLLMLNTTRIVPYAKDATTQTFLDNALKTLITLTDTLEP